ncbi:autotransporter assembly complex family protein [Cellvibrio sp. pealriver]|uniref:autotransporter assembly complex protein TamA n=1 Tax=Cellvibrio sp. pealriver TaxID=1622269 RepID=UPI000AE53B25|nr:autotransporter assembly complex family protein [Cellvibrio sp. pealriver]
MKILELLTSFSSLSCLLPRPRWLRPLVARVLARLWNRAAYLPSALLLCLAIAPAKAASPDIELHGGTKSLRENILLHLSLADESCKTPLWRLQALLAEAENEVMIAAQALGYYQLEYETKLLKNKECWGLDITLTPGDPVLVKEIRIEINGEGKLDPIFQSLYEKPGIKIGNKLNHGRYETLKARFGTLAATHGYFDAEFEHSQIKVNVGEKSAIIELIYDTGPRYRIGEIRLQHDILDDDFLRRYFTFNEGDYYDTDNLLELKNLYNASNYFAVASVAPSLQELEGNKVPVDIQLEARKRREYSIGLGAATDTGPRLLLGFDDRYVNQRGHSVAADIKAAEKKTEALLTYTVPMRRPAYEFLRVYTGYDKEITDTSRSEKDIYGASYSYFQANKWLQVYALDYVQEDSIIGTDPETSTDLIIPSVTYSRTQTDGSPYPMSGWSLMGKLSGSPQSLGSDFSFIQLHMRAKYITGFAGGRVLLRAEAGTTQTDNFSIVPASVRFYAGGDSSVRGYDYESLGPIKIVDGKEVVEGGNNLLVSSIEYDYRFEDSNWAVAAFFDQGNAANDTDIDVMRGAGAGVRWISPIGPIRVDVAQALDGDKGWRVHVSMGPDL